jgi:hypothetical protein
MADLTDQQNERLRAAMRAARDEKFNGNGTALAEAMGRAGPSISVFLSGNGGASMETADLFAEKIAHVPTLEIIGPRDPSSMSKAKMPGFAIDDVTRRRALVFLRQPPQAFTDDALELAFDGLRMKTRDDAKNPSAVAEAVRFIILGSLAKPPAEDSAPPPPPPTARRSRRRAGA